jgi:hypothetical protein
MDNLHNKKLSKNKKDMKHLQEYLMESSYKFKNFEDVEKFLAKFPDTATSWKDATDELRDIARISREYIGEFDGIEVDAIDYHSLKTPAAWNMTSKDYIRHNMERMSKNTFNQFLKQLNSMFN